MSQEIPADRECVAGRAPSENSERLDASQGPRGTKVDRQVENINYDFRLVTLRGPAVDARTIKVARRVENLRQVKVGTSWSSATRRAWPSPC
jgi:hypothetical protein